MEFAGLSAEPPNKYCLELGGYGWYERIAVTTTYNDYNYVREIEETVEPLTAEERKWIKVVKIKKEDVDQDHECAICLQDFVVNEDARELNCGGQHKFHEFCLFPWLEDNITCPICRERLK